MKIFDEKVAEIKYSILFAGCTLNLELINYLLRSGKKVIWFGSKNDMDILNKEYDEYIKPRFLDIFLNTNNIDVTIVDGHIKNQESLKLLEAGDDNFNLKQYEIEHSNPNQNLIITAGAGTGKTHVMVNRIMFLMHYCSDFSFADIAMITFTNKATDNMRQRLINTLNSKYKLTGNDIYLRRVEELSQITLSTIHSFFKKILVTVSPLLGYGTNLELTSYIYEKRQILKDIINEQFDRSHERVDNVLGLPVNEIVKLATTYWTKMVNCGITENELSAMDWGKASIENSESEYPLHPEVIQESLKNIFELVNQRYNELKFKKNAIGMTDIIHELSRVIKNPEVKEFITQSYKYIFCDEFQDSDDVQISTIVMLIQLYSARLFVVGDIKQSIYRFRGATDSAFMEITDLLRENNLEKPATINLEKNYRTSKKIMNLITPIFSAWYKKNLLKDQANLKSMIDENGSFETILFNLDRGRTRENRYSFLEHEFTKKVEIIFKEIEEIRIGNDSKDEKFPKVMVLTRKNKQLQIVKKWCEQNKIVCYIKEKGTFYKSDAVKDFCALMEVLLYSNEPEYLYNYVKSSYYCGSFDINDYFSLEYSKKNLVSQLQKLIKDDIAFALIKDLNKKPIISVIQEIVNMSKPELNYCSMRKQDFINKGFSEEDAVKQALIYAKSYKANLDKLLEILMECYSGDFASLYDLCSLLRLRILTDNTEEEAEVEFDNNILCVEGMTVHSSKGLEFEYVLIPFTDDDFVQDFRSDILISKKERRIGWKYKHGNDLAYNDYYVDMLNDENEEIIQEETRLLYVAMTRAIKGLYCFIPNKRNSNEHAECWADLLKIGGA